MQTLSVDSNYEFFGFIVESYTELFNTLVAFFDFVIAPRNSYISIDKETITKKYIGKPYLTRTMVAYCIKNILNVDVKDYDSEKSLYLNSIPHSLKGKDIPFEEFIQKQFLNSLHNKKILYDLRDEKLIELESIITPDAIKEIHNYLNFLLNTYTTEEDIESFKNREGDNIFFPKDYKFIDEKYNLILQSFIWVLCGLEDWIDNEVVTEDDLTYVTEILLNTKSKKEVSDIIGVKDGTLDFENDVDMEENFNDNIDFAYYNNNFFVSKTAKIITVNIIKNIADKLDSDEKLNTRILKNLNWQI